VAELQENVFRKVEMLEKSKLNMDRRSVPFVDDLADELQHALQSVQNEWREELTGLMEVLTLVTDQFMELKLGVDKVCYNHEQLHTLLRGDEEEEDDDDDDESGSGSSSSSGGQLKDTRRASQLSSQLRN
jgi:hypothetical protein